MSKPKHTPGPWKVQHSESKPAFNVVGTIPGGKYKIARCPYLVIENAEIDKREKGEGEANARLIAAAPEMLEALQAVVDKLDISGNMSVAAKEYYYQVANKANAAIAKATGEKEKAK